MKLSSFVVRDKAVQYLDLDFSGRFGSVVTRWFASILWREDCTEAFHVELEVRSEFF